MKMRADGTCESNLYYTLARSHLPAALPPSWAKFYAVVLNSTANTCILKHMVNKAAGFMTKRAKLLFSQSNSVEMRANLGAVQSMSSSGN